MSPQAATPPADKNACLMLADGTVFFGNAIGADNIATGEICFNTAMTGYQEVLTDPSYAGQIITFTFPHIGNTGCNDEDIEASLPRCAGLVVRELPTLPSNFRSNITLDAWLKKQGIAGICGIDTRALTKYIRKHGAQNGMIVASCELQVASKKEALLKKLGTHPSMDGLDLAKDVTTKKPYEWTDGLWSLPTRNSQLTTKFHVVALDYGIKQNILRNLAEVGCKVTVVPATSSAQDVLAYKPDGIFLSNGPGDPAATGVYALPVIKELIGSGIPIFGICLGHQLLGIALGGRTEKMAQGHRGANHPVKDLRSGKVIITSQNHGFAVAKDGLPDDVEVTHISLFDGTIQGLCHKTKPIFCLQGHPEASPGPHDSQYVFGEFVKMMGKHA